MRESYHFFYGGVLSQWSPTSFYSGAYEFSSCEQYMMARKAYLFEDYDTMKSIMASNSPEVCKRLGRLVRNFDQSSWDACKLDIVIQGNTLRAQYDRRFRLTLLNTKSKTLVEASPYDRIWGIGFSARDALANKPEWGRNLLGEALMKVRESMKHKESR